jgi:KDO2-lipid IV(A) lauroyltransferase
MSFLKYLLFRLITFPLAFLPYACLHALGNGLGSLLFYAYPKYRKRALSNLSLASTLSLSSQEMHQIAKASIQNLLITCLEYPKLAREKNIHTIAYCENPEAADALLRSGKGVIFFCGHQANWEILFLEGTSRWPGVAIGRPMRNGRLYRYIVSIREKFGGKIVAPHQALKEGMRALKEGKFLGIVGDQGMPKHGFKSPFLGREAWTSPLPALLSLRTRCPIIVATLRRVSGKYCIHYSDPLWPPEEDAPDAKEKLMQATLAILEKSIQENPGQWLWTHNRWKQQLPRRLHKPFSHESVCLILPRDPTLAQAPFRQIYPTGYLLTLYLPENLSVELPPDIEIKRYKTLSDILVPDYRFKLVLNFLPEKKDQKHIERHFLKHSAFHVFHLKTFGDLCQKSDFTLPT